MKIGYRRRYSYVLLLIAVLSGIFIFLAVSVNGWDRNLTWISFGAIIMLAMSILTRIMPYFELQDGQLSIFPLISFGEWNTKLYKFKSTEEFELVRNRLYLRKQGKRKRIWISPMNVEPVDWQVFLQALNLLPKEGHAQPGRGGLDANTVI